MPSHDSQPAMPAEPDHSDSRRFVLEAEQKLRSFDVHAL